MPASMMVLFGVIIALECVSQLHRQARRLPYAVEVFGFADEEGLRYHSAYLGSKAVAGTLDESMLALRDQDGVTLAEAIEAFGGEPTALASCRRSPDDLIGYCEVHIEQGPLLEQRDLPVGVVSAIAGQTRSELVYTGSAGHAGTVPMALRHDALTAAAEFILAVEARGLGQDQLMATVGQVTVYPGASNVIPGEVKLSLDVRHPRDGVRLMTGNELEQWSRELAGRRGVEVEWKTVQTTESVQCDPTLAGLLEEAIRQEGLPPLHLASGAGHDAAIMAGLAPIAMLFVRCKGGVSHSPLESVRIEDMLARNRGPGALSGTGRRKVCRMSRYDLIIRGGRLVDADSERMSDLAISDGLIALVEPDMEGTAGEEIDARGLHIFPGVIDAHVHFNEPGRSEWEGFATGTAALAAAVQPRTLRCR